MCSLPVHLLDRSDRHTDQERPARFRRRARQNVYRNVRRRYCAARSRAPAIRLPVIAFTKCLVGCRKFSAPIRRHTPRPMAGEREVAPATAFPISASPGKADAGFPIGLGQMVVPKRMRYAPFRKTHPHSRRTQGAVSPPDLARDLDDSGQLSLSKIHRKAATCARGNAGEAALRRQTEPIEFDELRCLRRCDALTRRRVSSSGTFVETRPSTAFFGLGKWRSGLKSPARGVSYSRK